MREWRRSAFSKDGNSSMATAVVTSSSFRQSILELVPHLRRCAEEAEKERRLPADTITRLRERGLFRAFVPRSYGGDERPLSEVLDVLTDLAVGCPSTAWVASLGAIHNIAVCWLDKQGQDEIFGEGPDVFLSSSVAPTGTLTRSEGGLRLTGKWGFSSGVDHASWVMLGAHLKGRAVHAPPEFFFCFVRRSEVTVIDDWHVSGMRATGSKSLELADLFVPSHRALLLSTIPEQQAPGFALHASSFYRLPWDCLFRSAFPPAALGTAIAALECFREYTTSRISRFSGRGFRTHAGSAMRMAAAAAQIDDARQIFRRDLAALDRSAREGATFPPGMAERISYDVAFVIDLCSRAVLRVFRGSGARVLYEGHPLQRHLRDIHAMSQHAAVELDGAGETYGRSLFQNPTFSLGACE